ncbi:MAG: hypothetical protein D6773_12105, partial [Alphaproteobacteria bacterium]
MPDFSLLLRLSLFASLLGMQLPLMPLQAQQKETEVPVVQYREGRLRGSLPYGEAFELRGFTQPAGVSERATVVQVQIFEETNKRRRRRQERRARRTDSPVIVTFDTLQAYYTATWWKREADEGELFSVYVDRPLALDTRYKFRINYFQRYTLDDAVTQRLVEAVKRDLYVELERRDRQSIRVADINAALQARVAEFADSIRFGYLRIGDNGRMILGDTPERPPGLPVESDFTTDLQGDVARVIRDERSLKTDLDTLAGLRARMRIRSEQPAFAGLLATLENLILTDTSGSFPLRPGDVRAIRGLFETGSLPETDPFTPLFAWLMVGNHASALRPDQQTLVLN